MPFDPVKQEYVFFEYQKFDFAEKVEKLGEAYKDDEVALEGIRKNLNSMIDYVNSISSMEQQILIARFSMSIEDYHESVERIDRARKLYHNQVVSAINSLNRYSRAADLEPFFMEFHKGSLLGDIVYDKSEGKEINTFDVNDREHRKIVAAACIHFVNEMFYNGAYKRREMDEKIVEGERFRRLDDVKKPDAKPVGDER